MRLRKINNELYVEFTTTKAALLVVAKTIGLVVLGLVSFYSLWVLTGLIK